MTNQFHFSRWGRRRRGVVLVLFVAMLFGLLAMAALLIDLGSVRHTRQQLQGAVESAALEGLRGFDAEDETGTDEPSRVKARERLFHIFDNDLDLISAPPANFGAGPVLQFSAGIPLGAEFRASELLTLPARTAYHPDDPSWPFQLNLENETGGDIVRGVFTYSAEAIPKEYGDYARDDFEPASKGPAILVRLKRSNEENTETRSSGPALPLIFGRGSLLNLESKAKGITVRATAIAEGRPALSVGPAYPATMYPNSDPPAKDLPGWTPFALTESFWKTLPLNVEQAVDVESDGTLLPAAGKIMWTASLGADIDAAATAVEVAVPPMSLPALPFRIRIDNELLRVRAISGATWTVERGIDETLASQHLADRTLFLQRDLSFGQEWTTLASPRPTKLSAHLAQTYAAIVDETSGRIIGFGRVSWTVPQWENGAFKIGLTKLASGKVAENAGVSPCRPLAELGLNALSDSALDELFLANRNLIGSIKAPALVR